MGKKPIKIMTVDTETYNGLLGDLKRIALYDGNRVTYGYTFSDIEDRLIAYNQAGYDVHVYIHNLEFDARKIPEVFSQDRILWNKCFIINGKLATITTKYYTIHDSFKLLPMSLKDLSGTKGFNVEHGKVDLFEAIQNKYPLKYDIYINGEIHKEKTLVNFLDKCPVDDELFLEYLGYDVISLYEVLQKLITIADIPERDFVKRISTASLSRYLFKKGYKGKLIKNDFNDKTDYEILCSYKWHKNLDLEELLRESYCGGRVEVFTPLLDKKGYHYDINSLYPYVMKHGSDGKGEYPIGKPRFIKGKLALKEFNEWKEYHNGLGFLNCKVFIPIQNIPPLPVKMGKLCFPCGVVYGTWTYEELDYAITECGIEILETYSAIHFDHTYPVFRNFVDTFYFLKEEGTRTKNYALRTLAKLILNVGYGYTGMRRDDKTSLLDISKINEHKDEVIYTNEEMGYIEIPTEITSEYIQVQVASYVTSRARLVLLKALKEADKVGTVYYCDTDSIVTDKPLPDSIVHDSDLGMFKLEGEPLKGIFLKPKVYAEIEEDNTVNVKFKGVSRETQKDLDFSNYERLLEELEKGEKEYVIVEKNKTLLRSIMYMQKQGLEYNYYETRDKKMNLKTVEKRTMDYVNNKTYPLVFKTEEEFEQFDFKSFQEKVEFSMT